tara:strand:+ start:464 stop:631 length:168 start_codon:yes stop_codon:yes gene_type:complete
MQKIRIAAPAIYVLAKEFSKIPVNTRSLKKNNQKTAKPILIFFLNLSFSIILIKI